MSLFIHYVYAYLRTDGSPYYIGKGKGKRAFSAQHNIAVPKDTSRIVFLETNLSDIGSLSLERRYIRWYGRKDNNTGILRNMTDGGEGTSNRFFSEEHRRKISEAKRGKKLSIEHRRKISKNSKRENLSAETLKRMSEANSGRTHSDETRRKIGEGNKGKIFSEERRRNLSVSNTGKKHSEETKRKMSKSKKNMSDETKKKMSDSAKRRYLTKSQVEISIFPLVNNC